MSNSINSIVTLFKIAFCFAIKRASGEMSIAEIFNDVKFLAKEIGIQPVPVPISRIESSVILLFASTLISSRTHATNSSVSVRGIKVFLFTKKVRP